MADWRSRLQAVIDDRGITLPQLALQSNYDYVTFWKALTKGKHTIKRETMNRICQVLKVSPDYIWNGHGGTAIVNTVVQLDDGQAIAWLDGELGREGQSEVNVPLKISSPRAFAWVSRSMDMSSVIPLESYVFFNPDLIPENNDIILAAYHGSVVLRRYGRVADEEYLMAAEPGFHAYSLSSNDRVLAVAVGYYQTFPVKPDRAVKPSVAFEQQLEDKAKAGQDDLPVEGPQ